MTKKCGQCKKMLDISCFSKGKEHSIGLAWSCKSCRHEYHKKYYPINRNKLIEYGRKYGKIHGKKIRTKLKRTAIDKYGGKCACCGELNIKFLTLDHINNDGFKETRNRRADIYRVSIKNDYTNKLQVMCYNCNLGKAKNGGVCPHKETQG